MILYYDFDEKNLIINKVFQNIPNVFGDNYHFADN